MDESYTHEALAHLSREYLVLVQFVKSRSEAFASALDVAKAARLFRERDLGSMTVYLAGFAPSADDANKAMDLIHYVRGWKGTHFYAKGRMIIGEMAQAFDLESVLKCFADSCEVRDYRAHCFRLIDNPYSPLAKHRAFDHIHMYFRHFEPAAADGIYVFPCRYMLQWFAAQREHPSTIQDQIQAEGVAKQCDVCPRFDPDEFGVTAIKNRGKP